MSIDQGKLKAAVDAIFNKYDADNSGTLQRTEVRNLIVDVFSKLQKHIGETDVQRFIDVVDQNKDGKITKDELHGIFAKIIKNGFK